MNEQEARAMTKCANCQQEKDEGLVVCWACFKYIDNCLKDSRMGLQEWLKFQASSNS